MGSIIASDAIGTNVTGYSYPGSTYNRQGVPMLWDKKLWSVARDELILEPLIGKEGSGLPIITKSELKTKKGDAIRLAMYGNITGLGKLGNQVLEGNEFPIVDSYMTVYINHMRQAWRDDGEMSRQRDNYNLNSLATKKLGDWLANTVERMSFNAWYYGYDHNLLADTAIGGCNLNSGGTKPCRNWYCADSANNSITYSATDATYRTNIAAAEATLSDTAEDYFGPQLLEGVAVWLKKNFHKPVKYKGMELRAIGFIHPDQTAQLRTNDDFFSACKDAMPRDAKGNLLFSGKIFGNAVGYWNNILLLESTLVHTGNQSYYTDLIATEGGSNVVELNSALGTDNVRRALFVGADSLCIAEGRAPHFETDVFDYRNKEGFAVSNIMGIQRAHFVSDNAAQTVTDQGTLVVSTYSPDYVI